MLLLSAWPQTASRGITVGLSRIAIVTLAILGMTGCVSCSDVSEESLKRLREEIARSSDARTVIDGNNQFALDLYARLRADQPGNLFFAPCSISTALAMTYSGARGDTEAQMAKILHFTFPQEAIHSTFTSLHQALNSSGGKRGYRLHEANRLWGQQGVGFLPAFLGRARDHYGAELGQVDFIGQREQARQTINSWIAKQTEDKILDLIHEGSLDQTTRLVLTNAVYFKGVWTEPFDVKVTKDVAFHVTSRQENQVPLMFRKGVYRYTAGEGLKILELTYGKGDLSMLVLLPDAIQGLADLEAKLTPDNLNRWLMEMQRHEVEVYLPRFKLDAQFDLGDLFKSMGMALAFTPSQADFSGMDGKRDLFISAVIQKAFVDINEEGTEAAAATGIEEKKEATSIDSPVVFRIDHPFVFLIRDNEVGSILFLGRVVNPKA